MSPSRFLDGDVTKGVIYGPRPSPLTINKGSQAIRKPVVHENNNNSSRQFNLVPKYQNPCGKRQPVIIYTRSPNIIHAQAQDFMALVQKLTGLDRSEDEPAVKPRVETTTKDEENESWSSGLTDEKLLGEVKLEGSCVLSPMYRVPDPYMADVPLFTPNSSDYFCSSTPNSMFQSASSISPSFMDFLKDY